MTAAHLGQQGKGLLGAAAAVVISVNQAILEDILLSCVLEFEGAGRNCS